MEKVIFLDFDGVLSSGDNNLSLGQMLSNDDTSENKPSIPGFEFDERCVRWLNFIINNTAAKIVISSSWRSEYTLVQMRKIWEFLNLPGKIIGYTPVIENEFSSIFEYHEFEPVKRGKEIQQWLDSHQIDKYCIIDDDSDMLPSQVFIQTNPKFGLTYESAKLVVEYLRS